MTHDPGSLKCKPVLYSQGCFPEDSGVLTRVLPTGRDSDERNRVPVGDPWPGTPTPSEMGVLGSGRRRRVGQDLEHEETLRLFTSLKRLAKLSKYLDVSPSSK